MRRLLSLLILILLPASAFASSIFSIPDDDLSRIFLSRIFGQVENALELGGAPLLKGILVDFNAAVLALGGIIVLYSLVVSTLNTSHEGEVLGKNWNSVWIPMRAAAGFALLLPVKTNSYALIQVFVMWVVVQGIGAADFLWSNAVDSLKVGSIAINPDQASNSSVFTSANKIFTSEVCMRKAAELIDSQTSTTGQGEGESINFGVANLSPEDICGSAGYKSSSNDNSEEINQATDNMVATLGSAADLFVQDYPSFPDGTFEITGKIKSAVDTYSSEVALAYQNDGKSGVSSSDKALKYMKDTGWIMAGGYFLNLSQLTNDEIKDTIKGPETSSYKSDKLAKQLTDSDYNELAAELEKAAEISTKDSLSISGPEDIDKFMQENGLNYVQTGFLGLLSFFQGWFLGSTSSAPWAPIAPLFESGGVVSPLLAIQATGVYIVEVVATLWLTFVAAMIALGTAAFAAGDSLLGLVGAGAAKGAFIAGFFAILTPIQVLFGIIFGVGLTWAYYVPLIPYFIFTLAAIGWIILVIEAMVAAPLMAIGILHPEGQHAVFGHSQTGIMILAGVFLRPALMIVGLFAAMLVSYVVVGYVSLGFMPVAVMTLTDAGFSWYNIFNIGGHVASNIAGLISLLVIYTMFILIALNKSFSLIHHVPDRVMRWIGQGPEQSAYEQDLQQIKSGVGQETAKGLEQVGDKLTSGGKEMASAGRQLAQDRGKASGGSISAEKKED